MKNAAGMPTDVRHMAYPILERTNRELPNSDHLHIPNIMSEYLECIKYCLADKSGADKLLRAKQGRGRSVAN